MAKKLKELQDDYQAVFNNVRAHDVLSDLRVFCYGTKSAFNSDPLEMARREGRREVFMRIMNQLKVDYGEIYDYEYSELEF